MSFILDALNRSNAEGRNDAEVPGLQTVHVAPANGDSRSRQWWFLLSGAALMGLGVWFLLPDHPPEIPPTAASTEAAPAAPLVKPPAIEPASKPVPQAAVLPADIAALYEDQEAGARAQPRRMAAPPVSEIQVKPSASVVSAAQQSTELTSQPLPTPSPAPQTLEAEVAGDDNLDIEALAKAAEAELARQRRELPVPEESSVPLLSSLRQSVKNNIPSIFYREHSWATNPRERSVVLNKARYREGERIGPGLTLVEILENGIVVDYRGTEFRLATLSSWVNL